MRAQKRAGNDPALFEMIFSLSRLGGNRSVWSSGGFWQGEAITDLATLGCSTGFALGAFFRSLVGAQAADFFEDAVHFEAGLEAFESAVNGLAFADLNFGHKRV